MVRGIAKEKRRRYYAFVEGVVPQVPENNRSRETLMLDCVDADAFESSPAIALENDESLSLVRVLSTRRRLSEDFGLPLVGEGQWLEMTLAQERGAPRAWTMPAAAQFASEERTNVRSIAVLPGPGDGSPAARMSAALQKACDLPDKKYGPGRPGFTASLELSTGSNFEIRAVDVGQASCTVFLVDGKPIGYFDVGAPLWRNQKSFRGSLCHSIPGKVSCSCRTGISTISTSPGDDPCCSNWTGLRLTSQWGRTRSSFKSVLATSFASLAGRSTRRDSSFALDSRRVQRTATAPATACASRSTTMSSSSSATVATTRSTPRSSTAPRQSRRLTTAVSRSRHRHLPPGPDVPSRPTGYQIVTGTPARTFSTSTCAGMGGKADSLASFQRTQARLPNDLPMSVADGQLPPKHFRTLSAAIERCHGDEP